MSGDTRLAIGAALALAMLVVVLYGLALGVERSEQAAAERAVEVRP